jgi:ribose-phosphate pyrophosphokinase
MKTRRPFTLFSGSSHQALARSVAGRLGVELGRVALSQFPDGEMSIELLDPVQGQDVFVLQSIVERPHHYLMELLLMLDALKRASVGRVVSIVPYYGYARQDRQGGREPIGAKLVADLLQVAGTDELLTIDLHAGQIQGFFDIPVDNLMAVHQLVQAVRGLLEGRKVVVAPDLGAIKLAHAMAAQLGAEVALIDKRRLSGEEVHAAGLVGSVEGAQVVIIDDMCSTGETLIAAAQVCLQKGAKRVVAAVTNGVLVDGALEKLEKSCIDTLVVTDTVPKVEKLQSSKICCVSVAGMVADAVDRMVS